MVDNVSRAKQALPSEFTRAAVDALRDHLVDFGRKIQANSKSGSCWRCGTSTSLRSTSSPIATPWPSYQRGIAEKLETEDIQSRLGALQQTMKDFETSFQSAGAAEKIATLEAVSDSASAAGANITKDQIEKGLGHAMQDLFPCKEETPQDECMGQFFSLWSVALEVLPPEAAQASCELDRCTTTLLIRVRQLGEARVTA